MKPALIAQIEVSLPAKADEMVFTILTRIAGKPLWAGQENRVVRGQSEEGKPTANIELRFDNKADRDDLASYLKGLDARPNVVVIGTIHDCYHDEGLSCEPEQEI